MPNYIDLDEYANNIYKGDCLKGMSQIGGGTIDIVVTDPPYGINYYSNWSKDDKYRGSDECEEERRADEWICEYREEFGRTLCDECVEELNKKLEVLERAIDEASKIFGVDPAYFGKEGEEEVDRQLRNLGYNPEDFRKD